MTRIIGGTAAGAGSTRDAVGTSTTRPTTDRVREALFSRIESWCGSLQGLRFLDLYAGSGAVGLEAWSRGAGVVTLVESDRRTARLITDNARALGLRKADVVAASVHGHADHATDARRTTWSSSTRRTPSTRPAVGSDLALLRAQRVAGAGRDGRRRAVVAQPASRRGRTASPARAASGTARPRFGTVTPPRRPEESLMRRAVCPGPSTRSPTVTSTSSSAPPRSSTR